MKIILKIAVLIALAVAVPSGAYAAKLYSCDRVVGLQSA